MIDIITYISSQVTWTNAKKTAMLNDFALAIGYQDMIDNGEGVMIANPVSKKDYANQYLSDIIRNKVSEYRREVARQSATYEELDDWN